MSGTSSMGARLGLSGTLEFRDAAGNILKTVEFVGSVPLDDTGMSVEPISVSGAVSIAGDIASSTDPVSVMYFDELSGRLFRLRRIA